MVVLGYLAIVDTEARTLSQEEAAAVVAAGSSRLQPNLNEAYSNGPKSNLEQNDSDDDDDDDDRSNVQLQNPLVAAGTALYYNNKPILAEQAQQSYQAIPTTDLKTSASHHHHGHGVKGWLDMGAWTGKKGAFGWYDKHPVGGKGRK